MEKVNLEVYDQLGDDWYEANDDPVALLRAQSDSYKEWLLSKTSPESDVLELGCGGGLVARHMAPNVGSFTGVDISKESLEVAKARVSQAKFVQADATKLPFAKESFDQVLAMDFLEHVDDLNSVLNEASRVLKPGGRFFFHTFNRTWIAKLVVIDLLPIFLPKTPKDLHVYRLFVSPKQLSQKLKENSLIKEEIHGFGPKINMSFFRLLTKGRVDKDFRFQFTKRIKLIGYIGYATKRNSLH